MHKFVYFLSYPIIWLFSKLPFRVLYIISDGIFFLFFYLIGYRKEVVLDNLKLAFPDKTNKELKSIQKQFFRHFVDTLIEAIKAITISEKSILKRYKYKNVALINQLYKEGKSVILVSSHYANWEWVIGLSLQTKIDFYGSYTKIQNTNFEKLIKDSRSKYGMICLKSTEVIKGILKNYKSQKQGLYVLISDQSPQLKKNQYWDDFLNVNVPIFTGAEMISKKLDYAVVNMNTTKLKRGYYESEFELITGNAKAEPENEITKRYLKITETHIRKQPAYYLWSHKRFKHKGKEPKA
jgi:KDO2-lipid IV(A) lauroyltransferase